MKTIIALVLMSVSLVACVDDGSSVKGKVEEECGTPPPAPGYTSETTTDSNGNPIVIVPQDQFNARIAWENDMESYALCALGTK